MRTALFAAFAALALAAPALADPPAAEVEALITNYGKWWNAGDGKAITTQVYKFDVPGNPMQTLEGFDKNRAAMKAQGYDHSDIKSVKACLTNRNTAIAEMRFARLKADGTPYVPGAGNLAQLYLLHKTADGWRVGAMIGMDPSATFECKSFNAGAAR